MSIFLSLMNKQVWMVVCIWTALATVFRVTDIITHQYYWYFMAPVGVYAVYFVVVVIMSACALWFWRG